jgi:outer membrane protein OmpA-like peptidoglycan-associated protein
MLAKLVTSTSLVLLIPFSSIASDIRQRPFTYSYDAANAQSEDLFVVCSDCPDNKLSLQPVTPKLAVRMSSIDIAPSISTTGEVAAESPKKEKPEIKGMIGTVHFDFDSSKLSSLEQSRLEQLLN